MPQLTLPYPPSTNRIWRHAGNRTFKNPKAKEYQQDVAMRAMVAGVKLLTGDIHLDVTLHPRKPQRQTGKRIRRIDLTNSVKCVEDALNGIAWNDDYQTFELSARVGHPIDGGALIVRWSEIGEE